MIKEVKLIISRIGDDLLINRPCPYCFKYTDINESKKTAPCTNCNKEIKIKHGLSKITLHKLTKNNYTFSDEHVKNVINFIKIKRTYIAEISRNVGLTEGQIRTIIRDLAAENKIVIECTRRKKFISFSTTFDR